MGLAYINLLGYEFLKSMKATSKIQTVCVWNNLKWVETQRFKKKDPAH